MSALDAVQLADICRHAGFTRDQIPGAVATALASSGGLAHYRYTVWPGPIADYRGLWALDVVRYPQYAGRPLDTPLPAARTARDACDEMGGWSWCGAWRTGKHLPYMTHAATAATMWPGSNIEHVPLGPEVVRSYIEQSRLEIRRLHNLPSLR